MKIFAELRNWFNFADLTEGQLSYAGCMVDALAPRAEEGRGDRRNVNGELHASFDPFDSEWGNPLRQYLSTAH